MILAAATGTSDGLRLAVNIGAMLVAFVALVALVNGALSGIGGWFGFDGLTLQWLLGKLFLPIALLLGVPVAEAAEAGSLIGQKLVINEFYAYLSFVQIKEALSPHTQLVVTFALCGFANLSSIAILLGGLAGYFGGWMDAAVSRAIEIFRSLPDRDEAMDGEPALSAHGGAVKAAGLRRRYAGVRQRGENGFGDFCRNKSHLRFCRK